MRASGILSKLEPVEVLKYALRIISQTISTLAWEWKLFSRNFAIISQSLDR